MDATIIEHPSERTAVVTFDLSAWRLIEEYSRIAEVPHKVAVWMIVNEGLKVMGPLGRRASPPSAGESLLA
jgi:hypothetical protein